MIRRLFKRKINETMGLFNGHFVEAKALYALEFDAVSCIHFIGEIDTGKGFDFINSTMQNEIVTIYQHCWFDHNEQKIFFNNTIFVLTSKRMIELGNNWCQVLHTPHQCNWAQQLITQLSQYKLVSNQPAIGFTRQAVAN